MAFAEHLQVTGGGARQGMVCLCVPLYVLCEHMHVLIDVCVCVVPHSLGEGCAVGMVQSEVETDLVLTVRKIWN